MQHIHYAFRGDILIDFSLYEYAASIVIVPKTKKNNAATSNETDNDEHDIATTWHSNYSRRAVK